MHFCNALKEIIIEIYLNASNTFRMSQNVEEKPIALAFTPWAIQLLELRGWLRWRADGIPW